MRTTARLPLVLCAVYIGFAALAACGAKSGSKPAPTSPAPAPSSGGKLDPPPPGPSGEMYEAYPGLKVPVEWVACEADTDCTALESTCCDYCSGGALVGVNNAHTTDIVLYVTRIACDEGCKPRQEYCPPADQVEVACMTGACIPVTPDVTGEWK